VVVEPIRDRRAERREATKAEIVQAAWELARKEGLAGLSLRDVARQVGMQAPSLYSYFDSKHAIYDAMFAEGAREYQIRQDQLVTTGDQLSDLKLGMHLFVDFCTEDPVRYQLLFQRTIPGFEPSAESYAIAVEGLGVVRERLASMGLTDPATLDLLTAIGTGLTDQQISNDPGGNRWIRLVDEATKMFFDHASKRTTTKKTKKTKKTGTRP
jgi:AcrR family transcriptional regulator